MRDAVKAGGLGQPAGARHRVVHEAGRKKLAALAVIDSVLAKHLAPALRHTAMHLTFDQHRLQNVAEIIDRNITHQFSHTGIGINFNLGNVAAIRIGRTETALGYTVERMGWFRATACRHFFHKLHQRNRFAAAAEDTFGIAHLGHAERTHRMRCGLVDQCLREQLERAALPGRRARAAGAVADHHKGRVTGAILNRCRINPEAVGKNRHEGGLVPLPRAAGHAINRDGAVAGHTRSGLILGLRTRCRRLNVRGQANPAQLAGLLARRTARRKAAPVNSLDGMVEHGGKIAAVVSLTRRCLVRHLGRQNKVFTTQFELVKSVLHRRLVDQALQRVSDVRTAGTAVRRHRRGVGIGQARAHEHGSRVVHAGAHDRDIVGADERAKRPGVGTQINLVFPAHRQNLAICIERHFTHK